MWLLASFGHRVGMYLVLRQVKNHLSRVASCELSCLGLGLGLGVGLLGLGLVFVSVMALIFVVYEYSAHSPSINISSLHMSCACPVRAVPSENLPVLPVLRHLLCWRMSQCALRLSHLPLPFVP